MSSKDDHSMEEKGEGVSVTTVVDVNFDTKAAAQDKALALLAGSEPKAFDLNSEFARSVKRKIDRRVLPIMVVLQILQNLDKATLSYGAIMGLREDNHLTANQYSWLGSIIYFGFLAAEVPTHILLQRLPIAKYAASMAIAWGIAVMCHAACSSFAGLAVCRFLLGFFEATTAPALVLLTGAWYTPSEQVSRVAAWYCMAPCAQIIGGLLAYGFYWADSFAWRGLFLLCGGITSVHGIVMFIFLSSSPSEAKWLTEEERIIALERVRVGKAGSESWRFNKAQLVEAMKDTRLYLFFLMLILTGLPNGGVGAFGPTIIQGFGFSVADTTLLSMAPGASELIGIALAVWLAKKTGSRAWTGVFTLAVGTVGVIMMLAIPADKYQARFAGYCLLFWWPIVVLFVLAYLTSSVSGTTKKLAFNCAYNIGYCIGNIIGPQTFRGKDAPNYYPAKFTMLAVIPTSALVLLGIWGIHKRENRKRDERDAEDEKNGVVYTVPTNSEFLDLTDRQQRAFRYAL